MIKKELPVFLVVGGLTVAIDFVVYRTLLVWAPLSVSVAKCMSFIAGTVFAYIVNQLWTFSHTAHPKNSFWRFILLYSAALVANVIVNNFAIANLVPSMYAVQIAFVIATGFSAALNFVGMKYFVFRRREIEPQ